MRRNRIFSFGIIEYSMFRRIINMVTMYEFVRGIIDIVMIFVGVILFFVVIFFSTRTNLGIIIWTRRDGSIRF